MKVFSLVVFIFLLTGCFYSDATVKYEEIQYHISVCDNNGGVDRMSVYKVDGNKHATVSRIYCKNGALFELPYSEIEIDNSIKK